jgi:hypothetical protein
MLKLNSKSWLAKPTSKSNQGTRKPRSPLNSQLELNSLESRVVPCGTASWQGTFCVPVSSQCGHSEFGSQTDNWCGQNHTDQCGQHQSSFGSGCSHGQTGQGSGSTTGQSAPSTISGVVYSDNAGTGVYSTSDAVLSGSTVTLTGTNNLSQTVNIAVTTGANGAYSFTGVLPGTYTITYSAVSNYVTEAASGTPAGTVAAAGSISNIAVTSGTNVTLNLPELPVAALS